MINELPMLLNTYYRNKNKEIDPKCPRCGNEYEDQVYWMWCTENKYTMKQAIKEILEASEEGKSLLEEVKKKEIRNYIEWLRRRNVPPCVISKENILPGSEKGHKNYKEKFTHDFITKIYENIWVPSREVISNMKDDREASNIDGNVPAALLHKKENKIKGLRKFLRWKKAFIYNNSKVDIIEDFD